MLRAGGESLKILIEVVERVDASGRPITCLGIAEAIRDRFGLERPMGVRVVEEDDEEAQ